MFLTLNFWDLVIALGIIQGLLWACTRNKDFYIPNSKLNFNMLLELVGMSGKFENYGHGVMPDYKVIPSTDILSQKDPEMEMALKLIKSDN